MASFAKLVFFSSILGASGSVIGLFGKPGQDILGPFGGSHVPRCDLPPIFDPTGDSLPTAESLFKGTKALEQQVERLQAVVRVPTVCYDDLGDFGEDERWLPFHQLQKVLRDLYPFVHQRANLTIVNTFGLVYRFQGSDPTLKPVLLTAHQDVVPTGFDSSWTHPPFNATFDGEWLWGRGAADDKNSLTALLSSVEALASMPGWKPKRTIVLAFGFDEECSGYRGARSIARHLADDYGTDGFAFVLDEGSSGIQTLGNGVRYPLVGVMEKGHVDIWFQLHVQGGHSSTPFAHTGIGIMAEIVSSLEAHVYDPHISSSSPVYNHLACQMRYSPASEPGLFRHLRSGDLESLARDYAALSSVARFSISSSVAVDIIHGGDKINSMPEVTTLGANFRIASHDSLLKIQQQVVQDIYHVVEKHNLELNAFRGDEEFEGLVTEGGFKFPPHMDHSNKYGTLNLTATEKFRVTPISPTSGPVWDVLAGTIRHSFATSEGLVAPVGEVMMGNTDTRHYLNLSSHIYRWLPILEGEMLDYHAVNERMRVKSHLGMAKFYYNLIRNIDTTGF